MKTIRRLVKDGNGYRVVKETVDDRKESGIGTKNIRDIIRRKPKDI